MSLRTGASLITLSLLVNKVSGIYGLLALLTGYKLSPFQLSMYIYSVAALVLTAYLGPFIRKQSPLHCLALAWFYAIDSIINAAYTAAFAVTWFMVISQHHHSVPASGPGSSTIDDTAGFTSPKFNVSSVEVTPNPENGQAAAIGHPSSAAAGTGGSGTPSLGHGVLQPESMSSISTIVILWTIRAYFVFVMLAYARQVLRSHVAMSSRMSQSYTADAGVGMAENPFSETKPEGQGWSGKLGRMMVSVGKKYWLGADQDETWMNTVGGKFRRAPESRNSVEGGPLERERRRRSGTGPPPAPPQQILLQGQTVPHHDSR